MHTARIASFVTLIAIAALVTACQTTDPGVRSTGFEQYTSIDAGTAAATSAAESVLSDLGLHDVKSSSTNVDGWASGQMADKSPVKVTLKRVSDNVSDISVKVGSIGDTPLGMDIIARVRAKLGIAPPSTAPATDSATK